MENKGCVFTCSMSLGEWFPTFRRTTVPSYWRSNKAFCDLLTLEDDGTTILRNVGIHSPSDTATHPSRPETSLPEDRKFVTCSEHTMKHQLHLFVTRQWRVSVARRTAKDCSKLTRESVSHLNSWYLCHYFRLRGCGITNGQTALIIRHQKQDGKKDGVQTNEETTDKNRRTDEKRKMDKKKRELEISRRYRQPSIDTVYYFIWQLFAVTSCRLVLTH